VTALKALSFTGYFGMMGGLLLLIFVRGIFSPSPIIIVLQIAAVLLFLWARITFGRRSYHVGANPTQGGLVTNGPYRYIRHPIYSALCLFTGVGAAAHFSWKSALAFALVFGFALLRIFCEETLVSLTYPDYKEYSARTWRMVPGIF